jgi:hypothetical protein
MKCSMRIATCGIALLVFSAVSIRDAAAVTMTLNLVQADSYVQWDGFFGGAPFLAQDGTAGTTDSNAAFPSNKTTYQGTITIDVDNPLAPTSIKILGSAADADPSGLWLPEAYGFLPNDVDGDLHLYEFPDDASSSVGTTPGTAASADHAIRIRPPGAPANVAYAALRDVVLNVTTKASAGGGTGREPVDLAGGFSSTTENFEYATGWWDYWLHPTFTAEKLRQRLELAGGDNDNSSASQSTFTALPQGGGLSLFTLTIPVLVNDPDTTAPTTLTGQIKATFISAIPEPTSLALMAMALAPAFRVRRRK